MHGPFASSSKQDTMEKIEMSISSATNSTLLRHHGNITDSEAGSEDFDSDINYDYFEIVSKCQHHLNSDAEVWGYIQIGILLTALPVNAVLMWLLLKGRTESSFSSILSINLSILNLLYILCLILKIYMVFNNSSSHLYVLSESLSSLNLVGCPLLLTCMCVERYVAVVWPITYMQAKKVRYRVACCALAWLLTLAMGIAVMFIRNVTIQAWCVAVGISILYMLMLLCLGGIIHVLHKKSPGNPEMDRVSIKRKALKNVVAVLVPFTIAYLPMLGLIPLMSVIAVKRKNNPLTTQECLTLQALITFPNIAIYIGPVFYLPHVLKLLCCLKRSREAQTTASTENNFASVVPSQTNSV